MEVSKNINNRKNIPFGYEPSKKKEYVQEGSLLEANGMLFLENAAFLSSGLIASHTCFNISSGFLTSTR